MFMDILPVSITRQRILYDLGDHGVRSIGHKNDFVGKKDRFVDVMRDHESVCPVSRQMRRTSSCNVPRVKASKDEKGSSISKILGSIASARAMPTRCFITA